MKKIFMLLLLILDIFIMFIYFNVDKKYKKYNDIYYDKLDGISYDDKILELDMEYDKIIDNISILTNMKIDNNYMYEDIILELDDNYNDVVNLNNEIVKDRDNLVKQRTSLRNTYNKILEEEEKKNTFIINGVPKINQYTLGYPTGCESAALTALLKYYGVNVSMSDIVNVLSKGDLPYIEDDIKYGGNPYIEFVGHPSSARSYGVFEKPIIQVANKFRTGVINGTGMKLSEVLNIVKQGRPVIVWVSMNMAVPYVSTSWIYRPTGEKIRWMANEHALVVIGYNKNQVIVSDSLNGSVRYYDKSVFESRYNTYGKRSVYY